MPINIASKHAVLGLTKSAALEYAKSGIRINAVAPGAVNTDMAKRVVEGNPQLSQTFLQIFSSFFLQIFSSLKACKEFPRLTSTNS